MKSVDYESTSNRTATSGKLVFLFPYFPQLSMTCYFRHMKDIFAQIGVEITQENKKEVDRKIHEYLGVEYKNCSQTWKLIKERRAKTPEQFITDLKTALTV